ncbi:MAG: membrane-bound lytic murein transglycosylase MltF [Proteobacteria bacterium]|nr:membrane-bound lytic murein transglycosylase MltF [Pseudomonadota bacterium]
MRALAVAAVLVLAALPGCSKFEPPHLFQKNAVEEIRQRGELRVVTLNLPTCYYLGAQGTEGLEFELATAYAASLNVRLHMYPVASERDLQAEIGAGRADIAAASLTSSPEWARVADAAAPYSLIPQLVVYRRDGTRPRDTLQLENARLAVRAGTPQERTLQRLKDTVAPSLHWEEAAPVTADPVQDVDSGQADYAITDEREFSFAHHLYPNVLVGFALPEKRPVQWMVRRNAPALLASVNTFFRKLAASGRLPQLVQESSGDTRPFAYEESREFQGHVNERLPPFRAWFEEAATQTGIDWRLLAAVGYQESKWDPRAVSGDGAVGVMMLTADTAQAMGIKDRNNPAQSIDGGARYLAQVREMIPDRIAEPDRTWLTLAAYNVGFGHLEDARIIAQSRGKNPDSWADVRAALPLLAQEPWFERAKRGYARGWEPVQFVDRIQRYLTLLEWQPGEGRATVVAPPRPAAPPPADPAPAAPPAPVATPATPAPLHR